MHRSAHIHLIDGGVIPDLQLDLNASGTSVLLADSSSTVNDSAQSVQKPADIPDEVRQASEAKATQLQQQGRVDDNQIRREITYNSAWSTLLESIHSNCTTRKINRWVPLVQSEA